MDRRWEKKLRPYTKKIMVIDDLANRNHDCDLLLDQNLVANFEKSLPKLYYQIIAILYLGQNMHCFKTNIKICIQAHPLVSVRLKDILVYFGGTDLNNLT